VLWLIAAVYCCKPKLRWPYWIENNLKSMCVSDGARRKTTDLCGLSSSCRGNWLQRKDRMLTAVQTHLCIFRDSGWRSRSSDPLRVGQPGNWILVEARFSSSVKTSLGANPASYTMRTGFFPGVNRPGRGVDHPLQASAEVEERVELFIYSPLDLRGLFYGKFTFFTSTYLSRCPTFVTNTSS
jgi:hypothetical protein